MTTQAILACLIFVATIILLVWQPVHMVIIGALIPAVLATCGLIDPKTAYTDFGNTTIVFFMGLVVVGEAFFKTGLASYVGGKIIGLLGKNEKGLMLGTGIVGGGLSAFMNDTGSTACLMPIVSSMAAKANVHPSKLLMALAYFCSMGGTITLAGTTPHIVANGILADNGLREFGFFEYAKIGVPILVVGIIYMCFIGVKFMPNKAMDFKGLDRESANDPKKMITVAVIFIAVLVCMGTNIVPMHIAGVFGAILVVLTGCITIEEAIAAFPTSTVFVIGAAFPLGKALVNSGATEYFVEKLAPALQQLPPVLLLGGITFLMIVITQFLTNSSATILMLPVALTLCQAAGINPLAGAMAVSVAASGAFTTPFGTSANMVVWAAGGYSMKDYFKCGLPLCLVFGITATICCAIFYL